MQRYPPDPSLWRPCPQPMQRSNAATSSRNCDRPLPFCFCTISPRRTAYKPIVRRLLRGLCVHFLQRGHHRRRVSHREKGEEMVSLRSEDRSYYKPDQRGVHRAHENLEINRQIPSLAQLAQVSKSASKKQQIQNQRRDSALNRNLQVSHVHFVPHAGIADEIVRPDTQDRIMLDAVD